MLAIIAFVVSVYLVMVALAAGLAFLVVILTKLNDAVDLIGAKLK